jgi:hypothetical protein
VRWRAAASTREFGAVGFEGVRGRTTSVAEPLEELPSQRRDLALGQWLAIGTTDLAMLDGVLGVLEALVEQVLPRDVRTSSITSTCSTVEVHERDLVPARGLRTR